MKSKWLVSAAVLIAGCVVVWQFPTILAGVREGVAKYSPVFPLRVPSDGMAPTLQVGDVVLVDRTYYAHSDPQDGDVVAFFPPAWACTPDQLDSNGNINVRFIKRCEGVPGDKVEVRNGALYRNGVGVKEAFLTEPMDEDFKLVLNSHKANEPHADDVQSHYWPLSIQGDEVNDDPLMTARPYVIFDPKQEDYVRKLASAKIPAGYYLMMGDNRNESFDGRSFGLVSRQVILGKVELPPVAPASAHAGN